MKYSQKKRPKLLKAGDTVIIDRKVFLATADAYDTDTVQVFLSPRDIDEEDVRDIVREWLGSPAFHRLQKNRLPDTYWPASRSFEQLTKDVNMILDAVKR